MGGLVRMELLKLLKRPMTWIMFLLLVGLIGFGTVVSALNLNSVSAETKEYLLHNLTLPGIIPHTGNLLTVFGTIFIAILAASAIGSEYSWGTLRSLLTTGITRNRFLLAKLLSLVLIAACFVVIPMLMNMGLAALIAISYDRPVLAQTVNLAWLAKLAAIMGRTYLIVLVPTLIAFFVGLTARSQAAGIGAALGLLIGEQIVSIIILSLNTPWGATVVNLFPGRNSQALANYYNSFTAESLPPGIVSEPRALLTLGGYCVICLLCSFLIFQRRDIRGAA